MTQDPEQQLPQQIETLQIKSAFQEQLIQDLNDELVQHGQRISALEQQLERLIEHVKGLQEKSSDAHERPPHY